MTETLTTPPRTTDAWLADFSDALAARDVDRAAGMFADHSFWRDLIAFSWNIVTVEPTEADGVTEAWIQFETAIGRGSGLLRLRDGKAWTLLTTLHELKGHEEAARYARPKGVEHGAFRDRETWRDRREREARELGYATQPYVLVIGGGQGGIALGARLRQLDIPAIVIDKHPRPGDQWRSRYKSLCLHDPVWYDHLPY